LRVVIVDACQSSEDEVVSEKDITAALCGGGLDEDHEVVVADGKEGIHVGLDILRVFLDVVLVDLTGVVCELYEELQLLFGETFACGVLKLQLADGQGTGSLIVDLVTIYEMEEKESED
jgi:hypothetical protein